MKDTIMKQLRESCYDSLQVIIVNDELDNVFSFRHSGPIRLPFSALKLVIIHWEALNELIQSDWSWAAKKCQVTYYSSHHHSPWQYLADEYSYFYKCDCVLLETKRYYYKWKKKIPNSFWKVVATRLLARVWLYEFRRPALRYFIVGNEEEGYQGIERDLTVPFEINPRTREVVSWRYNLMTGTECKRLLDERLDSLHMRS